MAWKLAEMRWRHNAKLYGYGLEDQEALLSKSRNERDRPCESFQCRSFGWRDLKTHEHAQTTERIGCLFDLSPSSSPSPCHHQISRQPQQDSDVRCLSPSSLRPLLRPSTVIQTSCRVSQESSQALELSVEDNVVFHNLCHGAPQEPADFLTEDHQSTGLLRARLCQNFNTSTLSLADQSYSPEQLRRIQGPESARRLRSLQGSQESVYQFLPAQAVIENQILVALNRVETQKPQQLNSSFGYLLGQFNHLERILINIANSTVQKRPPVVSSEESLDTFLNLTESYHKPTAVLLPEHKMASRLFRFRSKSHGNVEKDREETPPMTLYPDIASAHSSITNQKIPSPSPGMRNMTDPYAKMPSLIDLPRTPGRFKPGPASPELQAKLARSRQALPDDQSWNSARPLTPLLPPTPQRGEKLVFRQGHSVLDGEELQGFCLGPNDIPMKRLKRSSSCQSIFNPRDDSRSRISGFGSRNETQQGIDRSGTTNPMEDLQPLARLRTMPVTESIFNGGDKSLTFDRESAYTFNDDPTPRALLRSSREIVGIDVSPEDPHFNPNVPEEVGRAFAIRRHRELSSPGQMPEFPLPLVPVQTAARENLYLDQSVSEQTPYTNTMSLLGLSNRTQGASAAAKLAMEGGSHPEFGSPAISRRDKRMGMSWAGNEEFPFSRDLSKKELKQLRPGLDMTATSVYSGTKPTAKKLENAQNFPKSSRVRTGVHNLPASAQRGGLDNKPPGKPDVVKDEGLNQQHESGMVDQNEFESKIIPGMFESFDQASNADANGGAGTEEAGTEDEWETIRDSASKRQFPTQSTFPRPATDDSFVNNSNKESLSLDCANPVTPWSPLSGVSRQVPRPARFPGFYPELSMPGGSSDIIIEEDIVDQESSSGLQFPGLISSSRRRFGPSRRTRTRRTYVQPFPFFEAQQHPFDSSPLVDTLTLKMLSNNSAHAGAPGSETNPYTIAMQSLDDFSDTERRRIARSSALASLEGRDPEAESNYSSKQDDDSYHGHDQPSEAASITSLLNELDPESNVGRGTFSKITRLGMRGNITGHPDGTGMRATGSSVADFSSEPPSARSHRYERLSSEERKQNAKGEGKAKSKGKAKAAVYNSLRGLNIAASAVTTKEGKPISGPKKLVIPTTLPPANSLRMNNPFGTAPLIKGECTEEEIIKRIHMANDDMRRLRSECPVFPLREDHVEQLQVVRGRATSNTAARRSETVQPDGRFFEECYCTFHRRWEFSHAPTLGKRRDAAPPVVQDGVWEARLQDWAWKAFTGSGVLFVALFALVIWIVVKV